MFARKEREGGEGVRQKGGGVSRIIMSYYAEVFLESPHDAT